jgi:hypothetical protein
MSEEQQISDNQALHMFCQEWAEWHHSRRLFAPPVPKNILVRLQQRPTGEVPDAPLSSDLSFFNLSVLAEEESKGKLIFYLYYVHRVRNIKLVAENMGMGTSMWYRLLREFRAKAYKSYRRMMQDPAENPFDENEEKCVPVEYTS